MLVVVLLAIVTTQPQGRHVSISEHVASRVWTYLLFATTLTVCGSLLILFAYRSLGQQLGMPAAYHVILAIAWGACVGTAWVPYPGPGRLGRIHQCLALTLAFSLAALVACLPFATHVGTSLQLLSGAVALWYLYTFYLYFTDESKRQYFLTFQSVNITSFLAIFILASVF